MAYSRRISRRPYIYYLNPYVNRSNPISYSYGNHGPDNPELTYSMGLGYNSFVKTTSFNVTLLVLHTGNLIGQVGFASTQLLLPVPDEIVPAPSMVLTTNANVASNTTLLAQRLRLGRTQRKMEPRRGRQRRVPAAAAQRWICRGAVSSATTTPAHPIS